MARNPYETTLLLASKQALIIMSELQKMLGKQVGESLPCMQLMRAIGLYEKWNRENKP